MKLSGKETYTTTIPKIWSILMDVDSLVNVTPGLSRLEKNGEDQYDAFIDVKIGPVKGSFKGEMTIENKVENQSFTLHIMQKSKIGNVDAAVNIAMEKIDGDSVELSFDGKAKLSGLVARTGNRVLSGVANSMTKQFFANLDKELQKNKEE